MSVYLFSYSQLEYGDFIDYDCISVAETEATALGLVLEEYPNSTAKYWTCVLVDTSKRNVVEV